MARSEDGYDEGARWLLSDSQIIGRVQHGKHPQGVLLTLPMPYGEDYVAAVEKLNAASMTQFCELARGEYNAWKGEQVAKASRTSRDSEARRGEPEVSIPPAQESMAVNPLDLASVSERALAINTELFDVLGRVGELERERDLLSKIMEVLCASEDDEKAASSVQGAEIADKRKGEPLDHPSCEEQLRSEGSEPLEYLDKEELINVSSLEDACGKELELAPPPADAVDSKED